MLYIYRIDNRPGIKNACNFITECFALRREILALKLADSPLTYIQRMVPMGRQVREEISYTPEQQVIDLLLPKISHDIELSIKGVDFSSKTDLKARGIKTFNLCYVFSLVKLNKTEYDKDDFKNILLELHENKDNIYNDNELSYIEKMLERRCTL